MAFSPSSPVTGAAMTGLTSPTYTLTLDTPPNATTAKQYAVTQLGGTQTGVTVHSISSPFTATMFRPPAYKTLGVPDSNGLFKQFPVNRHEILIRKGCSVAANQPVQVNMARLILSQSAGVDVYDQANFKAMLSLLFGLLWSAGSSIADTTFTGNLN